MHRKITTNSINRWPRFRWMVPALFVRADDNRRWTMMPCSSIVTPTTKYRDITSIVSGAKYKRHSQAAVSASHDHRHTAYIVEQQHLPDLLSGGPIVKHNNWTTYQFRGQSSPRRSMWGFHNDNDSHLASCWPSQVYQQIILPST